MSSVYGLLLTGPAGAVIADTLYISAYLVFLKALKYPGDVRVFLRCLPAGSWRLSR
jgi:hypothetical protein